MGFKKQARVLISKVGDTHYHPPFVGKLSLRGYNRSTGQRIKSGRTRCGKCCAWIDIGDLYYYHPAAPDGPQQHGQAFCLECVTYEETDVP